MSIARRLRAALFAVLFALAFLAVAPPRAAAQNTGTTLIPGPPFINSPDIGVHQPEQDPEFPQYAHDFQTGHVLDWDPVKKSWIDRNTGEALGFDGKLASDGSIIPAPPVNLVDTGDGAKWQNLGDQDSNNPETARGKTHTYKGEVAEPGGIAYHWDRAKQSWVDNDTGDEIGFDGAIYKEPETTPSPAPPPCPTQADCDQLFDAYLKADRVSVAAGQTLIEAQNSREADLATANQLDQEVAAAKSQAGTTTVGGHHFTNLTAQDLEALEDKQAQAQALRDKLPTAQKNYTAAANAALAAWDAWQDCLKRMKDCPPKGASQAMNGTGTTSNPPTGGNPPGNAMNAIPGANVTVSQNGSGQQSSGGTSATPGLIGNGPWILIFPGIPPWNPQEHRLLGRNSDGTPRTETPAPSSGPDEWILIFPGLIYNRGTQLFYGVNGDGTLTEGVPGVLPNPYSAPPAPAGETPNNSQNPPNSNSSTTPAPTGETSTGAVGETPTTPALQCTASTPTLRHEGFDELIADIPLSCTGTPPPNSSMGLRSNVPAMGLDVKYSFGGQAFTNSVTPERNGHALRFNLPDDLGKTSNFKMDLDLKYKFTGDNDHLNLRFWDSPGINITPRSWTAPIKENEVGSFTPSQNAWGAFNQFGPFGISGSSFGWGMNRTPGICTDTTTTTFVPPYNVPLTSSLLGSGFGYSPPPCNFNEKRGTLTFGGSYMFDNPWTAAEVRAREFRNGQSANNTPGGVYNSESGYQFTPGQNSNYLNGGWGQTPQTPGNGYGGFYVPPTFGYVRPQSYYDDGPQYFGIYDPWTGKPYYCDYDFPDTLRSMPQIAQALADEARSRNPRESRASREPGNAHFQLVSMRSSAPISKSTSRAAGRAQIGRGPVQVNIEARIVEARPSFTYSIVSNGKSTGQAFELQVADPTGKVKTVAMRDGTVLEAIKPGVAQPVAASAGDAVVKQPLNGFCLEFHKQPPAEGTLYRIADPATQQKYSSLRFLDRAAAQMSQNNQFHPDSNPDAYKDAIFQYALWSTLEGWGQEEFTQHFIERTKENAESLHVPWTQEMENQLRAAAPGRWGDISLMMNQAQALEKASQDRVSSRQSRGQR